MPPTITADKKQSAEDWEEPLVPKAAFLKISTEQKLIEKSPEKIDYKERSCFVMTQAFLKGKIKLLSLNECRLFETDFYFESVCRVNGIEVSFF